MRGHMSHRTLALSLLLVTATTTACLDVTDELELDSIADTEHELSLITTLDLGFASGGVAISTGYDLEVANCTAVDADGNIYSGGSVRQASYPYTQYSAIMRTRPDGSVDTSFGYGGVAKFKLTPYTYEAITDLAIDPSGRIVAAIDTAGAHLFVARFTRYGDRDTSFGGHGVVAYEFPGATYARATSVAIDSSGRTVAGGYARVGDGNQFAVMRYLSGGQPDTSFSGDGRVIVNFTGSTTEAISDITTYGSYIIAVGTGRVAGKDQIAVARLTGSGALHTGLGGTGRVLTPVPLYAGVRGRAVAMNGSDIVVAGDTTLGSSTRFAVVRYNWNGTLDGGFDFDGIAANFTFPGWPTAKALAVAVDGEGRVVAGGFVESSSQRQFALMRYLANGTLDISFGNSGKLLTNISGMTGETLTGLAIDYQERIVAVGGGYIYPRGRALITRYVPRWSAGPIAVDSSLPYAN